MAQFWTDFSSSTTGAAPTGWTLEGFLAGECTVVETAGARGGKELYIAPTTNARRTAVWDLPGANADAEILVRMRSANTTAQRYPAILRKNSSGASLQCYTVKLTYTDGMRGGKYNTSYADLGTADVTKTGLYHFDQPTKYFYVRVRVVGTQYQAKAWNSDVAEPASWDIDIADSTLTAAGGVGLFAYYVSSGMYIDSFGVGTGGDTAPDSAVVSVAADFTASPTTGVGPLAVQFTDASVGATSWSWSFGDTATSAEQNPLHTYTTPGVYSVTLSINSGAASKTRSSYIIVQDPNAPTISGDFEGGNVDLLLSSVTPNSGDWIVTIVPRKQQNNYIATPAWWYFAAKLDKMTGKRPTFNVPWTDWIGKAMSLTSPKAQWLPCYTYTPEDPTSWVYATSRSWSAPNTTWQFDTAFTQDTVYVAYRPMCTPTVVKNWVDSLQGIRPLPNLSNYVVGTLPSTVDETGRTIPAQDILGFACGTGPAQLVVTSGVHPCEDHGTFVMQAFVEKILSSPQLSATYTVHVYPCVNPQGRWGRSYRGAFDSAGLTIDPARDWTDTPTLSCVQQVRAAIAARCLNGRPDVMFDFHGHYQQGYSHSVYGWNGVAANWAIEQTYQNDVALAYPSLEKSFGASARQPTTYFSNKSVGGPAGAFFIIEISDWLANQRTESRNFGTTLAQSLYSIGADIFGRWPLGTVGTLSGFGYSSGNSLSCGAVTNAIGYGIYRNTVLLAELMGTSSYIDTTAPAGVPQSYTYVAYSPAGTTATSAALSLTRQANATGIAGWSFRDNRFGGAEFGTEAWGFN